LKWFIWVFNLLNYYKDGTPVSFLLWFDAQRNQKEVASLQRKIREKYLHSKGEQKRNTADVREDHIQRYPISRSMLLLDLPGGAFPSISLSRFFFFGRICFCYLFVSFI